MLAAPIRKISVTRPIVAAPVLSKLPSPVWRVALSALLLLATAASASAVTCTTQAVMPPADREALIAAANPIAAAIAAQSLDKLQASLLPAVVSDWDGIRSAAQGAAPLFKGGEIHWRNAYLLDATDLKGPGDTQFFCTNTDSSITVTITLRNLPPGRYGLMVGDYPGTPLAGQLALILGNDNGWKLGGLFAREGQLDGHDGVWYWSHARELAQKNALWSAWFAYDTARWLLVPVDFLSSPNLEQLNREQTQLKSPPPEVIPFTVASTTDATRTWKITSVHLDTTLHTADLALTYEGTGLTDPQASRAEAVAVMSAVLKQHPELRDNFHGLWAYAETDGKRTFAVELAMHDIP